MNLLIDINRFLKATGMKPTRFGREVVSDPRFVFDLRNGREARPKTAAKVREFIQANQPMPALA